MTVCKYIKEITIEINTVNLNSTPKWFWFIEHYVDLGLYFYFQRDP